MVLISVVDDYCTDRTKSSVTDHMAINIWRRAKDKPEQRSERQIPTSKKNNMEFNILGVLYHIILLQNCLISETAFNVTHGL